MNELVQVFNGVRGYEQNGIAYLHIEDVARGLGFTTKVNETEYVRWPRVDEYLGDFGFLPQVANDGNPHDYYIPENIFYRLCMKAKNETAEAFQAKVADEIIPSIRRTGRYEVKQAIPDFSNPAEAARAWADAYEAKQKAQLALEAEKEQHAKDNQDWCNGFDILNQKKAEINSRQLATAMATASAKSRENEKLREQIGESKNWKSVRSISWLEKYFDVKKHNPGIYTAAAYQLQKICKENNWERHEIEDSLWGKVKTYPQCAIDVFEKRVEADNTIMIRYRYGYEEC